MAARGSTSRRRRGNEFVVKLVVPIALLVVVGVVAFILLRPTSTPVAKPPASACPAAADVVVGDISVPAGPIAGYCQPELINAASIIRAAKRWDGNTRAMNIGVMTAIGESGLRNLNYGDVAGPDSRGIFQQRANWGALSRRMNPYTAAFDFYQHMLGIPGWEKLSPTAVAHLVQGNANPNYYTPYYPTAETLVSGLLAHHIVPAFTRPAPLPPPNS